MAVPASIDLRDYIRNIPDFPKPGVMFKDITPLLGSSLAFRTAIEQIEQHFQGRGIDVIAAAEARGFIFGAPLAMRMGAEVNGTAGRSLSFSAVETPGPRASEGRGILVPMNLVPPRIVPPWIGPTPPTYRSLALEVAREVPDDQTSWPLARS